jgi:hypothetical protein
MKKIRNINTPTNPLNKNVRSYPKLYVFPVVSFGVLFPDPFEYGGRIFEVPVMVIE